MYLWRILPSANSQYRVGFEYNGEIMVWSENYTTKAAAQNCIASMKANAPTAPIVDLTQGETGSGYRFEIDTYGSSQFMTRFRASNGEIMVRSEGYTAKHNAKNCAQSVKANCADADVIDETVAKVA
ncbi:MAG: DUF1508 domain-containing protein [Pseudomonadota bacterium]